MKRLQKDSPKCVSGWRRAITHWRWGSPVGLGDPSGRRCSSELHFCWQCRGTMGSTRLLQRLAGSLRTAFFTLYLWALSRDEPSRPRQMFFIDLPYVAVLDCTYMYSKTNVLWLVRRTFQATIWKNMVCRIYLSEMGLLCIWGWKRPFFFFFFPPYTISGQIWAFHQCKSVFPPTRNKSLEPIPLLLFCR